MDREAELRQCERRLVSLISARTTFAPSAAAHRIVANQLAEILAEATMVYERMLAETVVDDRDVRRYWIELQLPLFTCLRRCLVAYYRAEEAERARPPAGEPAGRPKATR